MNNLKKICKTLFQMMKKNREWSITGLFAFFVILSFIVSYNLASTQTGSSSDKKLPIYCVDTNKKDIAISFDAAWGNVILC